MAALEITEDVLATDWTLSESDIDAVFAHCRGADHCLRFAIQLCTLRTTGRFRTTYDEVPLKATNYLTQQLEIDPVLFVLAPVREATEYRYQEQIRHYLGYQPFTQADEAAVVAWAQTQLDGELAPQTDLIKQAEEFLHAQRIVLPAPSRLGRLIATAINEAQQALYERIAQQLTEAQRQAFDELLTVGDPHTYSALADFKRSPTEPSAKQLVRLIDRYERLQALGIEQLDLSVIHPSIVQTLSRLARCYDARALRRIEPAAKRYAVLVCFLFEAAGTLLDHIIEMNDRLLTAAERTARNRFEEKYRQVRRNARRGLATAVTTLAALLEQAQPQQVTVAEFLAGVGRETLEQAVADCKTLREFEQHGLLAEIDTKYNNLRKYTPRFFSLEFGAAPGSEPLLEAIHLLRELNDGQRPKLPDDAPTMFITAPWPAALYNDDGKLSRRAWELGVYFAVKRALKVGELYLIHSRRHRDFWEMVYNQQAWQQAKAQAYQTLQLPSQFDDVLHKLRQEFKDSVGCAQRNFERDGFARITPQGELKLCKEDALIIPPSTLALREHLGALIPLVRIEKR